jgi:hypothetical protein
VAFGLRGQEAGYGIRLDLLTLGRTVESLEQYAENLCYPQINFHKQTINNIVKVPRESAPREQTEMDDRNLASSDKFQHR